MAIELIGNELEPEIGYVKEYICDTEADVANLPKAKPGSSAVVCATGKVYIVNASGKWVEFGAEG